MEFNAMVSIRFHCRHILIVFTNSN
ncbi:hypothetical protein LINGRAHAP2_LOCUS5162 [Linum grandiflorum]